MRRNKNAVEELKKENENLLNKIKYLEFENKILKNEHDFLIKKYNDDVNALKTYITQLGMYIKEKYNDNIVFKQDEKTQEKTQEKKYNIDDILDKLSDGGWDSLSKDEIEFLKNQKNS